MKGEVMPGQRVRIPFPGLVVSLVTLITVSAAAASSGGCDRECLKSYLSRYLDAMLAQTPSILPLSADVKFTEDCIEKKVGEGFWKTVTTFRDYRLDVIDMRTGSAFAYIVAEENGSPVLFALRLRVVNEKIIEIETMVVKNSKEGMIFKPEALKTPSEAMTKMPDADELNPRQEMIDAAVLYPQGLQAGSFVKADVPFGDDAYRFENGQQMAGKGCTIFSGCDNIKTQTIPTLAKLKYKVALVDEQNGIVVIRMNFGPGSVMGDNKSDLDVFESFKVYGGKIHAVEAFMQIVPSGTEFGWDYDMTGTAGRDGRLTGGNPAGKGIAVVRGAIMAPARPEAGILSVRLYDITGKQVYSSVTHRSAGREQGVFPLPQLGAGYYIGSVRYGAAGNSLSYRFPLHMVK